MKNKMMKLVSVFLTLLVIATSIPTSVFAAGINKIDENSVISTVDAQSTSNANTLETSDDNSELIETTNALAGTVQAYFESSDWNKYIVDNSNISLKYTVSKAYPQLLDYIQTKGDTPKTYIENTMDVFVKMTDGQTVYASTSSEDAIVNMYRHGYYYDEVRFEGQNFSNDEIAELQSSVLSIYPYSAGIFGYGSSVKSTNNISGSNNDTDNSVVLKVSKADDPYVNFTESLNLDASVYNYVYITMKSTSISAATVYIIAGSQTAYGNQTASFTIYPDGQYHTYKIDLTKVSGYTGTLKAFRLDLDGAAKNDSVEIKEIKFVQGVENKIENLYLANIFHVYSDKLHYEMQLAASDTVSNIEEIGVKTEIPTANVDNIIVADKNGTHSTLDGVDWNSATYVGFDIASAGVFGLILPVDETTGKLNVTIENGNYVIIYSRAPEGNQILPGSGSAAENVAGVGNVNDFYMGYRIHTDETHTFDELKHQAYIERNPLTEEQIVINEESSDNATFVGYDGVRGSYMFDLDYNISKMYENFRNKHFAMNFTVKSDDYKRLAYFVVGTDVSLLECSAILDENLMMLPVPIEVGKNFCGDKDENIFDKLDIGYSEAILPIIADTDVAREYTVLHLYENWGDFQLKQISYIEYTNAYYHLSTGTVESNCLVPWGWPNNRAIPGYMPDHRGMSGTEWPGSRTHQAAGSHSFFRYGGSYYEELKYQVIDSYGPTYVDYTSEYLTDDEKIKTTRRHLEYSDLDENRTYYMFEYEALANVTLSKSTLQFYGVGSNDPNNKYRQFGYLDSSNVSKTRTFSSSEEYYTLGNDHPYFSIFDINSVNYANVSLLIDSCIVTRSNGTQENIQLAIRCSNGSIDLTIAANSLTLSNGDKISLNAILLPWGSEESDYSGNIYAPDQNVRDVRENTLLNPVRVAAIKDCTVTENLFMYKLETTNGKSAEFSISGGKKNTTEIAYREGEHTVPVRIYGFDKLSVPIVYEKIDGVWVRHDISSADNLDKLGYGAYYDGYNVYYDEDGTYSYSFVIDVTEATERTFMIELDENFTSFEKIEGEDPSFLYEKPMNLFLDYSDFGGALWKEWFGRVSTCYEEDGSGYISLYPHPSKSESCINELVWNDKNEVTGQYMVLKYRLPVENANNADMLFQFFLSSTHTDIRDPADKLSFQVSDSTLEADGEWHVMIVDLTSYNKGSFAASEDGQYRFQYVRFDPFNGITDPNKEYKDRIDVAYFAFHDDISEIFEYVSDISSITVVSNGKLHTNDNHKFDDGVVTANPTYTTPGETTFTCTICGGIYHEEIPVLPLVLGDIDCDGDITNADILQVLKYIYNPEKYPLEVVEAADVNKDGKVTSIDMLKIFKYIYNSELYPLG